jgi:preprotein translocase subunit SecD
MKRLGWIGLLVFVAGCATAPPPMPPPPPPPPPPAFVVQAPAAPSVAIQPSPSARATPPAPVHLASAHLVLEIDPAPVWREKLASLAPDVRQMLRARHIEFEMNQPDGALLIHILDPPRIAEAGALLRQLCAGNDAICDMAVVAPGGFALSLSQSARRETRKEMLDQSLETVARRLAELAPAEPVVRAAGDRIVADLPGYSDLDTLRRLFGPPPDVTLHLVDDSVTQADIAAGRLPPDVTVMDFMNDVTGQNLPPVAVHNAVLMTGDRIAYADKGFDDMVNQPDIALYLDAEGKKEFADISARNVGNRLAIVLRGRVLEAPVLRSPVTSGELIISGNFTDGAAAKIATLLHAGTGPALRIVELRMN